MAGSNLNKFLDDLDEKLLECSICFKRLKQPKSMNCLHSFCQVCLEEWVEAKGRLSCPTCLRSYPIPEGGISSLPPNTFLNNLLEIIEQVEEGEKADCFCGKSGKTKYYCIECRLYLCSSCKDYHLKFPGFKKHKLLLKKYISSMNPQQLAALHPPLCAQHNESLNFFCTGCEIPICLHCAITDHNAIEGNHKVINITQAFKEFEEKVDYLKDRAGIYKNTLEDYLENLLENTSLLVECKTNSLEDIDDCVEMLINNIKTKEKELKKDVERIFNEKRKVAEKQTQKLRSLISEVNTKLSYVDQLLHSDEATAMKSSKNVVEALAECIDDSLNLEPVDVGQIYFIDNEASVETIEECDIGIVSTEKRPATIQINSDAIESLWEIEEPKDKIHQSRHLAPSRRRKRKKDRYQKWERFYHPDLYETEDWFTTT